MQCSTNWPKQNVVIQAGIQAFIILSDVIPELERTVCVSVKSIMCISIPTHVLMCIYYKSIVICPDNQASFSTPEWLAARIAPVPWTFGGILDQLRLHSLQCQWWTTGLCGVFTITMWGVFLWLLIWGYRLEAITISMTKYSLIFWMAIHISALTT